MNKKTKLHAAHLVDAWFPSKVKEHGVYGGAQVRTREIVRRLKKNHQCEIELFYPAHQNILIHILWPFILFFQLLSYQRQNTLELIHVHGPKSALAAKMAQPFLKVPIIYTAHNGTVNKRSSFIDGERFIFLAFNFDHIISVSETFKKNIQTTSPLTVIKNGVNLKRFEKVRVEKSQSPMLIWVGKDDPEKGLPVLKKAIKKVRLKYPDFKAELVTGGRLTGEELIRAYKRAHMFVLPSLVEAQPISLLEAWASKLPVIATRVGDNPHMIEHEKNGLLVEPNNVSQLYSAIMRLIRARSLDKKLAKAGYLLVKQKHSWDSAAEETYQIYQQVLSN